MERHATIRALMTKLLHMYGEYDLWADDTELQADATALYDAVRSVNDLEYIS